MNDRHPCPLHFTKPLGDWHSDIPLPTLSLVPVSLKYSMSEGSQIPFPQASTSTVTPSLSFPIPPTRLVPPPPSSRPSLNRVPYDLTRAPEFGQTLPFPHTSTWPPPPLTTREGHLSICETPFGGHFGPVREFSSPTLQVGDTTTLVTRHGGDRVSKTRLIICLAIILMVALIFILRRGARSAR